MVNRIKKYIESNKKNDFIPLTRSEVFNAHKIRQFLNNSKHTKNLDSSDILYLAEELTKNLSKLVSRETEGEINDK